MSNHQNICQLMRQITKLKNASQFVGNTSFHRPFTSCATNKNSEIPPSASNERKMGAWQIHAYGDLDELQYSDKVKIPTILGSNDVLIKVKATSVNPIDIAMLRGYGASTFNLLRCTSNNSIEFPLTLGRDFVGEVVHKGMSVRESVQLGESVWGVVPLHRNGCHSEYVTTDATYISSKPVDLDDVDAACVLYAGLTAWSGLFVSGQLGGLTGASTSLGGGQGKRICILGASGGVGNSALQIAKAENVEIVATCATDAMPMIQSLGVKHVVDYNEQDANAKLVSYGPYDIILDCAGKGAEYATELPWTYEHYVTFTSPMLKNFDQYGLASGSVRNLMQLIDSNFRSITAQKGLVKWAYFVPAPHGIEYLKKLIERKKYLPIVEETFDFKLGQDAYKRVAAGHLRGKIVMKV